MTAAWRGKAYSFVPQSLTEGNSLVLTHLIQVKKGGLPRGVYRYYLSLYQGGWPTVCQHHHMTIKSITSHLTRTAARRCTCEQARMLMWSRSILVLQMRSSRQAT